MGLDTQSLFPAILILIIGGFSISLGQSTVLFANRVRPLRFFLSLLGEVFVFFLSVLLWAFSIYAILNVILDVPATLRTITILAAYSFTPYLLGFLVFLPYLGLIWKALLRVLAFFIFLIAVGATFDLTFWAALLTCGLGWIFLELLARLPFLNVAVWQEKALRLTTGEKELLSATELADRLAAEVRPQDGRPGGGLG